MMTAVWALPLGNSTDKFVLLALADHATRDTHCCWPSVAKLMEKTHLSERAIRRSFKHLEDGGHIEVIHMQGHSNTFRILTPAPGAPTPARRAPPPLHLVHPTPATVAPITVMDPSFEPSRIRRSERPLETVAEKRQSADVMHRIREGLRERSK